MIRFDAHINPDRQAKLLVHIQAAAHMLQEGRAAVEALDLLLEAAVALTGAERGLILGLAPDNYGPDSGAFEAVFMEVFYNLDQELLERDELASTRALICAVVENGKLEVADSGAEAAQTGAAAQAGAAATAMLGMPLHAASRVIGVLYLDHTTIQRNFTRADFSAVEYLAGQAAQAVNIELLEKKLSTMAQEKAKFVSVVTHELRIPMTSIKGYTEMLKKGMVGPVNEMQGEFLQVIHNNVERMSVLVSDLSDLSHAESGRLNLQITSLSLADSIVEVVSNFKPRIAEKGQTLEVEAPDDLPPVAADPARVVQVLSNLISNAHKYSPASGKITIRARQEAGAVRVEVVDNGIGISPEDQAQLFSQFFRSEDPDVREQQGWGLGLSIAKRLVNMMNGDIGAQSTPKQGSIFWFTLPLTGDANG